MSCSPRSAALGWGHLCDCLVVELDAVVGGGVRIRRIHLDDAEVAHLCERLAHLLGESQADGDHVTMEQVATRTPSDVRTMRARLRLRFCRHMPAMSEARTG
ncbi:MAG: hypothetical protein MR433_00025 [Coriobacteriaceae bacterium]|nr:hypothetical protein [Coriobacteriaceae bacterium]